LVFMPNARSSVSFGQVRVVIAVACAVAAASTGIGAAGSGAVRATIIGITVAPYPARVSRTGGDPVIVAGKPAHSRPVAEQFPLSAVRRSLPGRLPAPIVQIERPSVATTSCPGGGALVTVTFSAGREARY